MYNNLFGLKSQEEVYYEQARYKEETIESVVPTYNPTADKLEEKEEKVEEKEEKEETENA